MDDFKEEVGLLGQKKGMGAKLNTERTEDVVVEDGVLLLYHTYWCAGGKNGHLFKLCSLYVTCLDLLLLYKDVLGNSCAHHCFIRGSVLESQVNYSWSYNSPHSESSQNLWSECTTKIKTFVCVS